MYAIRSYYASLGGDRHVVVIDILRRDVHQSPARAFAADAAYRRLYVIGGALSSPSGIPSYVDILKSKYIV